MKNKKGLSQIITTLLLATLAMASVAVAASQIYPLLGKANFQASPEYNCLQLQLEPTPAVEIQSACRNSDGEIELKVKRSTTQNVPVTELLFTLNENSVTPESSWRCSEQCSIEGNACIVPQKGETKTYYFTPSDPQAVTSVKLYLGECEVDTREVTNC